MSERRHTPGPWYTCRNGDCPCATIMCDDYPVATVTRGEWGDTWPSIRLTGNSLDVKAEAFLDRFVYGSVSEETAKANARLIAAAPDMLEALEALLALHIAHHNEPAHAKARAAISRARAENKEAESNG